ncbi:Hypothetical predicted protein [Mytilus galloprovincialis]|uniref:Uncharacterized protein n=1 Tax=Mytilus galloprovincialis TaxID=29158 RepID=A0A8B6CWV0_MYTGA|nr:Hypothetical predicted protein [Mytilus galloprovincialis]
MGTVEKMAKDRQNGQPSKLSDSSEFDGYIERLKSVSNNMKKMKKTTDFNKADLIFLSGNEVSEDVIRKVHSKNIEKNVKLYTIMSTSELKEQAKTVGEFAYNKIAYTLGKPSSAFLTINARIGAGISKDSFRRFITSRCKELEQTNRFICPQRFTIASFDNLDKNQSYSVVGSGKDKSGFHGTTIQTATPCPSLPTSVDISVNIDSLSDDMVVDSSRGRSIPIDITTAITNPKDNIGLPSSIAENRFRLFFH